MTSELLALLVRANLAAAVAILVVLALRLPARRLFGAQIAYALWLVVPAAALTALLPAREAAAASERTGPAARLSSELAVHLGGPTPAIWLAGALAATALIAWRQAQFMRQAAQGRAGPAVVGVFAPRMVAPTDIQELYSAEERRLIRAHERAHIDRGDPRVNGLIALAQCLNWFNPLVHLAAACARVDQELACDATVIARHPRTRRRYAQTMLKIQLSPSALPLGCHWTAHPLETRIAMLAAPEPSERRAWAGGLILSALVLAGAYLAWAAQPERAPSGVYFDPYPRVVWRCWPSSPDPVTNRCARIVTPSAPPRPGMTVLSLQPGADALALPARSPAADL